MDAFQTRGRRAARALPDGVRALRAPGATPYHEAARRARPADRHRGDPHHARPQAAVQSARPPHRTPPPTAGLLPVTTFAASGCSRSGLEAERLAGPGSVYRRRHDSPPLEPRRLDRDRMSALVQARRQRPSNAGSRPAKRAASLARRAAPSIARRGDDVCWRPSSSRAAEPRGSRLLPADGRVPREARGRRPDPRQRPAPRRRITDHEVSGQPLDRPLGPFAVSVRVPRRGAVPGQRACRRSPGLRRDLARAARACAALHISPHPSGRALRRRPAVTLAAADGHEPPGRCVPDIARTREGRPRLRRQRRAIDGLVMVEGEAREAPNEAVVVRGARAGPRSWIAKVRAGRCRRTAQHAGGRAKQELLHLPRQTSAAGASRKRRAPRLGAKRSASREGTIATTRDRRRDASLELR